MDINLARQAVEALQHLGWSLPHACGAVANIMEESGLNPHAVGDGGHARGICQWHEDRQSAIRHGCGVDVRTAGLADQLRGLDWEMRHTQTQAMSAVANSATAFQAGYKFCVFFERPANVVQKATQRGNLAQQIYHALGGH